MLTRRGLIGNQSLNENYKRTSLCTSYYFIFSKNEIINFFRSRARIIESDNCVHAERSHRKAYSGQNLGFTEKSNSKSPGRGRWSTFEKLFSTGKKGGIVNGLCPVSAFTERFTYPVIHSACMGAFEMHM